MMTLRILKKKSKQALPILEGHYPDQLYGDVFLAERGENSHGLLIRCDHPRRRTRGGCLRCTCPLPGTPMIGGMSGYEEPEWDEETAFERLQQAVLWNDRPATMTDREWRRTLAISGVRPVDITQEIEGWDTEVSRPTTTPSSTGA